MTGQTWLLISLLITVLVVVLAIVAIVLQRRSKRPPDYRMLFIMGLTWIAVGFSIGNYFMSALGVILAAVGLVRRKEWKKTGLHWNELTKEEKAVKIFLVFVLSVLIVGALVLYFLARR